MWCRGYKGVCRERVCRDKKRGGSLAPLSGRGEKGTLIGMTPAAGRGKHASTGWRHLIRQKCRWPHCSEGTLEARHGDICEAPRNKDGRELTTHGEDEERGGREGESLFMGAGQKTFLRRSREEERLYCRRPLPFSWHPVNGAMSWRSSNASGRGAGRQRHPFPEVPPFLGETFWAEN